MLIKLKNKILGFEFIKDHYGTKEDLLGEGEKYRRNNSQFQTLQLGCLFKGNTLCIFGVSTWELLTREVHCSGFAYKITLIWEREILTILMLGI